MFVEHTNVEKYPLDSMRRRIQELYLKREKKRSGLGGGALTASSRNVISHFCCSLCRVIRGKTDIGYRGFKDKFGQINEILSLTKVSHYQR